MTKQLRQKGEKMQVSTDRQNIILFLSDPQDIKKYQCIELAKLIENSNFQNSRSKDLFDHLTKPNYSDVGFFAAAAKPLRTESIKNFAKDFFFPTLVNHALKINNIVKKIFVSLLAIMFDLVTFPCRLFVGIPLVLLQKDSHKKDHPLIKIVGPELNPELASLDRLRVALIKLPDEKSKNIEMIFKDVNLLPFSTYEKKLKYKNHCDNIYLQVFKAQVCHLLIKNKDIIIENTSTDQDGERVELEGALDDES